MRAEEYLDQIRKIDAIIINKRKDYKRWVDRAMGMGDFSVSERVQSSGNLQRGATAIISYVDLEREINELTLKRQAVIKTIERLPSAEYKVIYKLYVDDYSLKEVAYHYRKSYEWAKKHKHRGIALVQRMINEDSGKVVG